MWNTLGMSGWWISRNEKHNNLEFIIDNKKIYFNDMRNFGTFTFCNVSNLDKKLKFFLVHNGNVEEILIKLKDL